jgi:hypothetical protein
LIYFAGHGVEAQGVNWLVPIDAELSNTGDLEYEAIRLDLAFQALGGARMRILVLDACRNNPFGRSWSSRTRELDRGLKREEADDVLVLYAAAPGQVALDGADENSPFAAALAKRLPEVGLAIQLLGGRVRDDVLGATGGKQRPYVSASITGEPFFLVPSSASDPPVPQSESPRTDATAAQAWALIKDATEVGMLEAFIRHYGNTFYADLAKARLTELTKTKVAEPSGPAPSETCSEVLAFLKNAGAFGGKPVQDSAYAERVNYYARGQIGRADVARIARDYERKFPTRIYEIDESSLVLGTKPHNVCVAKFEYTYLVRNDAEERSGRGVSEFTVRRLATGFEIVSETGNTLSRAVHKLK